MYNYTCSTPHVYVLLMFLFVAFLTTFNWVVYKQFPGIPGELQGGVLEGFDLFFGEFSDNFPDESSIEIPRKLSY